MVAQDIDKGPWIPALADMTSWLSEVKARVFRLSRV